MLVRVCLLLTPMTNKQKHNKEGDQDNVDWGKNKQTGEEMAELDKK